jgi:hypothetical protein
MIGAASPVTAAFTRMIPNVPKFDVYLQTVSLYIYYHFIQGDKINKVHLVFYIFSKFFRIRREVRTRNKNAAGGIISYDSTV